MFSSKDDFEKKNISRRDFMKLLGAGSLFVGLGAIGIPNILKNIESVSCQRREQIQQIQLMLLEQLQRIQLMLQEQV